MSDANGTSPVIGIDLGTTNSVVAAVVQGKPQVLTEQGERILPSVVGLDPSGKMLVGAAARNQLAAFPESTVASIKRRMGTMEPVPMGTQSFTPPEISAILLRRLRERASAVLGTEVERAVVTVPAFFDENQRQATRKAGELAGLKVERIINEPTAATLVYHAGSDRRQHVIVYDFGGGTFDVSIVRLEAGVLEVLSSRGDTKLGGDDLDAALVGFVADSFMNQHGIDLRTSAMTRWRLTQACETAKRKLSEQASARIAEEFIAEKDGQPLNLDLTVRREEYERLIAGLIDRTITCVDEALREANLTMTAIDDLVLVGGSTRTPLVVERLSQEFGLEPSRAVDPDLAVAMGAAIQGAMLAGATVGPVLVDVATHTLGIEAVEDSGPISLMTGTVTTPIIRRGAALPASYEEDFFATHDDQKEAEIHVLQGEHEAVSKNQSIGKFMLPLQEAGKRPRLHVRFDLSLSGMLKVTARQAGSDEAKELVIDNALSEFEAEANEQAVGRLEDLFAGAEGIALAEEDTVDVAGLADVEVRSGSAAGSDDRYAEARELLARAERMHGQLSGEDAEDVADATQRLKQAIEADDQETAATAADELEDVLFYVEA